MLKPAELNALCKKYQFNSSVLSTLLKETIKKHRAQEEFEKSKRALRVSMVLKRS